MSTSSAGFLDGRAGFLYAFMLSPYEAMIAILAHEKLNARGKGCSARLFDLTHSGTAKIESAAHNGGTLENMKIIVTGGAGYIGSHACKALARRGFESIVFDNLSRGNRWAVKWGPLEFGDVADSARLRAVLEQYRPVAIMHFAAYAYVGESVQDPLLYYRNNVSATASLLQTLVDFESLPVVFSSTCATYGVPERTPIAEDHPQHPINPYGFSKLVVERMLADLDAARGLRSISLRYFNAAGADPDGEIGKAHDPETHLIPLVLAAARDGKSVSVFGDDYDTTDGTCIRDYVHVLDIAEALSWRWNTFCGESRVAH